MVRKIKKIRSRDNPDFKRLLRLLSGRGLKKYRLALLSGPKQVREVLRDFPERCAGLILSENQDLSNEMIPGEIRIVQLSHELYRDIDIYGTGQPILVIRFDPFPRWSDEGWPPGCTLFCPFQDPVNVGAVIRSAAAFGVSRVVLLKESAHPYHHKAMRVSGSTLFRVPLLEGPSIRRLNSRNTPMITLDPRGLEINRFEFPNTFGLIPGLEGPGITAGLKEMISLGIPMESGVESINASMATGIALFMWKRGCGMNRKLST